MRATKLILIDGLPGSGKTTTASWLASRLRSAGMTVNLFLENHAPHPLNVGGSLHPSAYTMGDQFFQRYTPESYIDEGLRRRSDFVDAAARSEAIGIFDSYPFQSDIRVLMQLDATTEQIHDYAEQVETIIAPLRAVLIYFNHRDLAHAFENVPALSAQRGKEWMEYVVKVITQCPYATARKLEGFIGALAMLGAYKELTDSLLDRSAMPRVMLEDCAGSWERCYREIETFLELTMAE